MEGSARLPASVASFVPVELVAMVGSFTVQGPIFGELRFAGKPPSYWGQFSTLVVRVSDHYEGY